MAFSNILPSLYYQTNDAGQIDETNGTRGPGYASLEFRSSDAMINSKYDSQRYDSQSNSYHTWKLISHIIL